MTQVASTADLDRLKGAVGQVLKKHRALRSVPVPVRLFFEAAQMECVIGFVENALLGDSGDG
jgi:hypothetical protein